MSHDTDSLVEEVLEAAPGADESQSEMRRILELPEDDRQPSQSGRLQPLVDHYSERFGYPSRDYDLLVSQALALDVFRDLQGLVGDIGVGHGKTLLTLLLPHLLDEPEPYSTLVIHPASTRETLFREVKKQRQNFRIETRLEARSYTQISKRGGREFLYDYKPRLIVADEAHYLKRTDSARTKRIRHYLRDNPETRFVPLSGTLANSTIDEYAHLAKWALRHASPLPREYTELDTWQKCLDVEDANKIPGLSDWSRMQPLVDAYGPDDGDYDRVERYGIDRRKEIVRDAYRRRYQTCPGVVQTTESAVGASIHFRPVERENLEVDIPPRIEQAISDARDTFLLPDGSELDNPLDVSRATKQLSLGFFYRWDWDALERGEDREWLHARREWGRQVRRVIRYGPRHLDTPYYVRQALDDGEYYDADAMAALEIWREHEDKPEPPTEAVWESDFLIRDILSRVRRWSRRGDDWVPMIWYSWQAVGEALSMRGFDVYWPNGDRSPEEASGDKPIAVSVHAARRGQNLQQFASNIVIQPPTQGYVWQQLLGRTHRTGQTSDVIRCGLYSHTTPCINALEAALYDTEFVEEAHDRTNKLLLGDWSCDPTNEGLIDERR